MLRAVAGAVVALADAPYATRTDSAGAFRLAVPFAALAPAPQARVVPARLVLAHPRLTSLGIAPRPVAVRLARGRAARVEAGFPSPATVRRALCPATNDQHGVVVGVVRRSADAHGFRTADSASARTVAGAVLQVYPVGGARPAGDKLPLRVRTNEQGLYVLCDVPPDVQLRLTPSGLGLRGRDWLLSATAGGLTVQDLWVEPPRRQVVW